MCVAAEELVLGSPAQKLLLDPSSSLRTFCYGGVLHNRSPDCHLCTSCWSSLEDGGQCVWPLYTPACAFYSHSHSGTVSSVGFCLRKLHIFYLCKDTHVAGVFTF